MAGFNRGETVIVSIEVRTSAGVLANPATSMTVTISNPSGTVVVDAAAMSNDGTGLYHYDYLLAADAPLGRWPVRLKATDASRVSIEDSDFEVFV